MNFHLYFIFKSSSSRLGLSEKLSTINQQQRIHFTSTVSKELFVVRIFFHQIRVESGGKRLQEKVLGWENTLIGISTSLFSHYSRITFHHFSSPSAMRKFSMKIRIRGVNDSMLDLLFFDDFIEKDFQFQQCWITKTAQSFIVLTACLF